MDTTLCNESEISVVDSTSKLISEKLLITVKDIEICANTDKQYQSLINKIGSAPNITIKYPDIK